MEENTTLFGKKLSEIPCFKYSYLYGISGGILSGLIYFMCTSKVRLSTHVGVSIFACTTLGYWTYCRYHWSKEQRDVELIKRYMIERLATEGTALEQVNNVTKADKNS